MYERGCSLREGVYERGCYLGVYERVCMRGVVLWVCTRGCA